MQEKVAWGYGSPKWMSTTWVTYKLTAEGWRKLWEAQEGRCAGCREEFAHPLERVMGKFGVKPEVDHRHVEGRRCEAQDVRGLLCRPCNQLLGKLQDNQTTLENLVDYLRKHGDYYGSVSKGK